MADNACVQCHSSWQARFVVGFIVVGWFLSSPQQVDAQGQLRGAVHGTVKDQQGGVLAGVVVTAIPTESRPPVSTTTDISGFYTLRDLSPGEYRIEAALTGFATIMQPAVEARAGRTLSLDLVMSVGGVDEVVKVTHDTPLLEASSATTAVNVSGDLQRALPISSRRNWSDALALAPGLIATDETLLAGAAQNYFLHGSNNTSHVIQIDGADLSSGTSGQPFFTSLNTDIIADVQVTTAGADASAPIGTGAIINLATKSGTNNLAGAFDLTYQPTRWNDSNVPGGTSRHLRILQPDLALGGPIKRDALWFFTAYRRANASSGVSRNAAQINVLRQLSPSFEPFDVRNTGNLYFLKLTAQPSITHKLSGFYQHDVNRFESAEAQDAVAAANHIGGHSATARLSSAWNSSVITEAAVSYNNKTFETPEFSTGLPFQQVFRTVALSAGRLVGNDPVGHFGAPREFWSDQPTEKLTASLDVTFYRQSAIGTHELKFGTYLQPRILSASTLNYVNGGESVEHLVLVDPIDPSAGARPFRRSVWPESTTQYSSRGSDMAAYVQDVWRHKRLTTTIGIRVDRVSYADALFDVTTQDSIDLGPRVGLNFSLREDGSSVARFAWSRVPDRVAGAAFAATVSPSENRHFDLDLNGTFETVDTIPGSSSLSRNRVFAPSLHQPWVHELSGGYRQQLRGKLVVDLGFVRRLMKDRFTLVETNGRYDGNVFLGYHDESQNEIYSLTNNAWNWPVYTALELSATKQTGRLDLMASYTRQWQHLEGTWQPNDPASRIQPNAFANDRGIGSPSGSLVSTAQANSLSGSSMSLGAFSGGLPWQDHIVRTGGRIQGPWGVSAALHYTYQSGPWSGPIVRRLAMPDPAFGPATVRLSNGRTVQNPLATVIRFVYENRGAGQFHVSPFHLLNVRLAKTVNTRVAKFTLLVDVFNLTNNDADQGLISGGNVLGGANFQVGINRQTPRVGQVGVRVAF